MRSSRLTALACFAIWTAPLAQADWFEMDQLVPSNSSLGDFTAWSLDVAGNTLVIGTPQVQTSNPSDPGAVAVFELQNGVWVETALLVASDAQAGAFFGKSVAISPDESRIVVGAENMDHSGLVNAGKAYVFVRQGGSWVEEADLQASDAGVSDGFGGRSVSISGNRLVVGAWLANRGAGNDDLGAAYVFHRTGSSWNEVAKLEAFDADPLIDAGDQFGEAVSIDGDLLAVGAHRNANNGGANSGAIYLFEWTGSTWEPHSTSPKLTAPDVTGHLGCSVALSGGTLAAGAYTDPSAGHENAGAAYVFVENGGAWVFQAELLSSTPALRDYLGVSVDVDGDRLVAGAFEEPTLPTGGPGHALVFERTGTTWTEVQRMEGAAAGFGDQFGFEVAIDPHTIVCGAPAFNQSSVTGFGSAYVFGDFLDCNGNQIDDLLDIASGFSQDCNQNQLPDECDLASGTSVDLDGSGVPDECECLVENYCLTAPNSDYPSGGAIMGSLGTPSVSQNQFVLTVSAATLNQLGLFYYGPTVIQVPFGDGYRCIGSGSTGTFRLGPPVPTNSLGDASRTVDFDAPPADSGPGELAPGTTWHFQFWYRDPLSFTGSGFNFSDGLRVRFCL